MLRSGMANFSAMSADAKPRSNSSRISNNWSGGIGYAMAFSPYYIGSEECENNIISSMEPLKANT
jgi:hypothetical protein